jgi:fatty-acyl-CoA synthase
MNPKNECVRDAKRSGHEWRKRTVWQHLLTISAGLEAKDAFVNIDTLGNDRRISYGAFITQAELLSANLVDLGVRRGDRLALWMTNLLEWLIVYFACLRLGVTLIPINTWFKREEVAYVLAKSRVRHLVMLDRFRKIDFIEALRGILPEWEGSRPGGLFSLALPELRNVIVHSRSGEIPAAAFSLDDLLRRSDADAETKAREIANEVVPDDLALLSFTSGSTGFPKGVQLEQWGLITNGLLHTKRLGITDKDKWFSAMPLFHAGANIWGLMTMLTRGGTLVFTEAWDPDVAVLMIERERCTCHMGGAIMYRDELARLDDQPRDFSSLWLCGGVSDPALAQQVRSKYGVKVFFSAYGLTEGYGPVSLHLPDDAFERQTTTNGKVLEGRELRVVDPATKQEVLPGKAGEAWIRGLVMRSYYELPAENAAAIDEEGWFHTQDLVTRDAEGYVTFVGRLKAMFKVGDENVAAEEVETCILQFPGIGECIVIGVPDERKTEIGRAYVVVDPAKVDTGTDLAEELRKWCSERLASFKVPRDFFVVESLPMTGSGKLDRALIIRLDQEGRMPAMREGQPLGDLMVEGVIDEG